MKQVIMEQNRDMVWESESGIKEGHKVESITTQSENKKVHCFQFNWKAICQKITTCVLKRKQGFSGKIAHFKEYLKQNKKYLLQKQVPAFLAASICLSTFGIQTKAAAVNCLLNTGVTISTLHSNEDSHSISKLGSKKGNLQKKQKNVELNLNREPEKVELVEQPVTDDINQNALGMSQMAFESTFTHQAARPLLTQTVDEQFIYYICTTYKLNRNQLNVLLEQHLDEYRKRGDYIDDKLAIARLCSNYYYGTNQNLTSIYPSNQRIHEYNFYTPNQTEQIMAASARAYFSDIEGMITMLGIARTEAGTQYNSNAAINHNNIAGVKSNRKIDTFDTLAQGCDNATRILGKAVNNLMKNGTYNDSQPLLLNVQPTYNTENANWSSVTLRHMAEVCRDYGIDWDSIFYARYGISNPLQQSHIL